jgi:hypothetical protein
MIFTLGLRFGRLPFQPAYRAIPAPIDEVAATAFSNSRKPGKIGIQESGPVNEETLIEYSQL